MSFYSLPSLIMKHPKHKDLGTAYLFYYATDAALSPSGSQGGEEKAKAGFDVFNALTMMDNNLFLNEQLVSPNYPQRLFVSRTDLGPSRFRYAVRSWRRIPREYHFFDD
jgi:hypothetical protein